MRYWVSWYETLKDPSKAEQDQELYAEDYHSPKFPEGVKVFQSWWTGTRMSDNATTMCAYIEAPDEEGIKRGLEGFEMRFLEERGSDWEGPYGPDSRFGEKP